MEVERFVCSGRIEVGGLEGGGVEYGGEEGVEGGM